MCTFPVKELLALSHQAAAIANLCTDPARLASACDFVKTVNDLRLIHEDLTDCQCWYGAVAAEQQTEVAAA